MTFRINCLVVWSLPFVASLINRFADLIWIAMLTGLLQLILVFRWLSVLVIWLLLSIIQHSIDWNYCWMIDSIPIENYGMLLLCGIVEVTEYFQLMECFISYSSLFRWKIIN